MVPARPSPDPSRREALVAGALGAAALLGAARPAGAQPRRQGAAPAPAAAGDTPLFRISLAEWSVHRALRGGGMEALDFPKFAREKVGVDGIEYVNVFFQDKATDFAWLRELDQRCKDNGVRSLMIMCDAEGDLGDDDDGKRRQAVENHFRWIAAGAFLGCHSIRVNAHGPGPADALRARTADSLHRLGEMGDRYGLNVIVENHGGLSSNGAWLAGTIRAADHPRVGTLPDFGNFDDYDRYQGVTEMMPYARAVSAKSYDFDDEGEETRIDYHRMLEIVVGAGYHQWLGVEYEGDRLSELDGILATKKLLERVRAELS